MQLLIGMGKSISTIVGGAAGAVIASWVFALLLHLTPKGVPMCYGYNSACIASKAPPDYYTSGWWGAPWAFTSFAIAVACFAGCVLYGWRKGKL